MVLSFAGAALAIHSEIPADTQAIVAKGSTQLSLGGEIRVRGWYYDNLGPYFGKAVGQDPQDSNSKANYDQRVRLSLDAVVSPNVSGPRSRLTSAPNTSANSGRAEQVAARWSPSLVRIFSCSLGSKFTVAITSRNRSIPPNPYETAASVAEHALETWNAIHESGIQT